MKVRSIIVLIFFLAASCTRQKAKEKPHQSETPLTKPTAEIAAFIEEYEEGDFALAVDRMKRVEIQTTPSGKTPTEKKPATTQYYTLPILEGISDGFQYTVIHNPAANTFEVIREGGIGGIYERFAP